MGWALILSMFFVQFAWTGPLAIERSNGWLDGWSGAKSLAGQIAASVQDFKPKDLQMGSLWIPVSGIGTAYYQHVADRQKRIQELRNFGVGSGDFVQAISKKTQGEDTAELLRLLNLGIRWEEKEEEEDSFRLGAEAVISESELRLEKPTEKVLTLPKMRLLPESPEMRPREMYCPITRELMSDPVVASDGHSYERIAITQWIVQSVVSRRVVRSPMTNLPFEDNMLLPNIALRTLIEDARRISRVSVAQQTSPSIGNIPNSERSIPELLVANRGAQASASPVTPGPPVVNRGTQVSVSPAPNPQHSTPRFSVVAQGTQVTASLTPPAVLSPAVLVPRLVPLLPMRAPRTIRTEAMRHVDPHPELPPLMVSELEWESNRRNSPILNFAQAQAYCISKGAGWRLPTIWELYALYEQSDVLGDDFVGGWFWSRTPKFELPESYWFVNFTDGLVWHSMAGFDNQVRCVRSISRFPGST